MRRAVLACILASCLPAETVSVRLPPFTREVLPNGMVLCLMRKADAPLFSLRVIVRGGAESDPPEMAGLSSVIASLAVRGTATRTAEEFALQMDALGADIQSAVNPQRTSFSLDLLPAHARAGIDLMADALLHPAFSPREVSAYLARAAEAVIARKDIPGDAIWQYFRSFFFAPPHPYGRPYWGDERSLERIDRAAIVRQHARMYVGRNFIVTAAGPFEEGDMRAVLARAFGGAPAAQAYRWRRSPRRRASGRLLLVEKPDATETQFVIGLPGTSRTHPDRIPLWLVNNVFGGRFTSLLNERLRLQSALTYGAYSYVEQDRLDGAITLHSSAATADTGRAVALALDLLRGFARDGVSAGQLAAARAYIEAAYPADNLQTAAQLADRLAELELFGLGRDEIDGLFARLDAVTVAQANRAAKRYYSADPVVVLLGDGDAVRSQVRGMAPGMTEASISEPGFRAPEVNGRHPASRH